MSNNISEILEKLKKLSLLEAAELVQHIEESFGVDASNRRVICNSIGIQLIDGDEDDEPIFDVVLEEVPADKKIGILKVVRTLTGLGLKEAKEFVESAPQPVKEGIDHSTAQDIKQQLEAAGAKVALK